jgi:hypothetical protein
LIRHATGYRVQPDEDTCDLSRFRALSGRAALAEDGAAVGLYAEALALWTGPVGAGLEHPIFVALDGELARTAHEAADVALRSGHAPRILPALLRIAGWRPLDEALQARVALALTADGRQAEAVARFRTVRERLSAELGLDPGPELRQAQERVLRQDVRAVTIVPAQLPGDHPFFTGRAELLARAEKLIADDRATMLAFDGMPGIGKTTIAVHLAHRLAESYPYAQLYIDLHGFAAQGPPLTAIEALHSFLGSLGVRAMDQPTDLNAAAGLYRGITAGRRMLVVLDNAVDFPQVRHLLPATPEGLALVTSRTRITGLLTAGAQPLPVDLPAADEARENLVKRLGRARVDAETEAVQHLIEHCGRHPLAIAMVAARAVTMPDVPLRQLVEDLADASDPDSVDDQLTAVFSWSYRALTPAAARLFRLIPLHANAEITPTVAAALARVDRHVAATLLHELGTQMLTQVRAGSHQMHDLLRRYAAALSRGIDTSRERDAASARLTALRP